MAALRAFARMAPPGARRLIRSAPRNVRIEAQRTVTPCPMVRAQPATRWPGGAA